MHKIKNEQTSKSTMKSPFPPNSIAIAVRC